MARTTLIGRGHGHERAHDAVDRQDTPGAAEARVSLKLAAEGYSASRFGVDAGGRLTSAAVFALRGRCLHYYGQLHQVSLVDRLPDDLRELHEHPLVEQVFANVQVAALAYSVTRSGADAHGEYTRAAIGELCAAAVFYVETLLKLADHGGRTARRDPGKERSKIPLGEGAL